MFYREGHRRLFRAMLALTEQRVVIDHITLRDELLRRGELEAAGGLEYLAELVDAVPTAANLEFHAKIVRDKAILRRLIEASTSIITEAYDGHSTANDLLDSRRIQDLPDLPAARERRVHPHQGDAVADDGAHRNAPAERQSDYRCAQRLHRFGRADVGVPGRRSWWSWRPGRPWARRRSASTSRPTRRGEGQGVAIFSLEMSKEALVQRMLTRHGAGGQPPRCGRARCATPDFTQLARAAGILQTYPALDRRHAVAHAARDALQGAPAQDRQRSAADRGGLSAAHAEPGVRGEPGAGDLRHLALAQGAGPRARDPGHRAVAALPRVGAARRGAEADPVRPPGLGRHRAGRRPGDLHPPARVLRPRGRDASAGLAEVMLAKNRNGPTGDVQLRFVREYTRFDNLSNREDPE